MGWQLGIGIACVAALALGTAGKAQVQEQPLPARNVPAVIVHEPSGANRSDPQASEERPAGFLLDALVSWLSVNFDLQASYAHPKIAFVSAERIGALRLGIGSADGRRDVVAVYVDRERTILLPQGWTGRSPADVSVLVHELVHHLQNLDKRSYDCPQQREKLAYEAQEKWLSLFGRSLLQEFQIDAMTLKATTACL